MGLGPFVTSVRSQGKVGQAAGILGQGFTGVTSVSFNGVQANFTIGSDTFIKATVPSGATSGYVTVTTPSGTLTSNLPFHVITVVARTPSPLSSRLAKHRDYTHLPWESRLDPSRERGQNTDKKDGHRARVPLSY